MEVEGSCALWLCFGFQRCCWNCAVTYKLPAPSRCAVTCRHTLLFEPGQVLSRERDSTQSWSHPLWSLVWDQSSGVHRQEEAPWTFLACQQVWSCVGTGCAYPHTPPHFVLPARGQRHNWCQASVLWKVLVQDMVALIQPSFFIQSRTTGKR